jgi:hypothetical protein
MVIVASLYRFYGRCGRAAEDDRMRHGPKAFVDPKAIEQYLWPRREQPTQKVAERVGPSVVRAGWHQLTRLSMSQPTMKIVLCALAIAVRTALKYCSPSTSQLNFRARSMRQQLRPGTSRLAARSGRCRRAAANVNGWIMRVLYKRTNKCYKCCRTALHSKRFVLVEVLS